MLKIIDKDIWLNPSYIVKLEKLEPFDDEPARTLVSYHSGTYDQVETTEPAEDLVKRINAHFAQFKPVPAGCD